MQRTVDMPKLGMTMTDGMIVRWHVAPGDIFAKDDVLAEVETDKVELEIEAPFAGRVTRLAADSGQTVPVGEPILICETESPAATVDPGADIAILANQPTQQEHTVSAMGKQLGSRVRVPSTPAARRIAQELGVDLESIANSFDSDRVGSPLRAADVRAFAGLPGADIQRDEPALTPLARKVAQAHALSHETLVNSTALTPGRRIRLRDVEDAIATAGNGISSVPDGKSLSPDEHGLAHKAPPGRTDELAPSFIPLTSMRHTIAERTTHSFTTTPHIYLDIEVDMTEAEALRAVAKTAAQRRREVVPTLTAILVRAVAAALCQHPEVNARFVPAQGTEQPEGIQLWRDINIGFAVAVPDGLLVPVLHNADRMRLQQIAAEVDSLTRRAREGTLVPDDLSGGSLTISNLGMFGIDTFHAVLNEPQSAILAVGRITRGAVVIADAHGEESIEIRSLLKLSLSADHRVLDGAVAAKFLATLRELLEEPRLLV